MTHSAPCLTELADDIENHGYMLALLTDVQTTELSPKGRIGLIQLSTSIVKEFDDIQNRFRSYRASLTPNC
ncbi:hypothetical protein SAMN04490198_2861 [Pseudomonas palleroniana]|uniref:Uncharacterized protein n=1 Tax=Pseudomonas palleroniana TaxID=191390 RepID=A0A1H5LPT0_9PSED|nr:hypothetical protein SAMN04490198_2861 [Pseudomonas palleroniana]